MNIIRTTTITLLLLLSLPLGMSQDKDITTKLEPKLEAEPVPKLESKPEPKPTVSATKKKISFVKDIKPIFENKCMHCHNKITMDDRVSFEYADLAFSKDNYGKVYIVRGKPDESLLVKALESPDFHEKQMPMVGLRTTKEENAKFRQWISEGAHWPAGKNGIVKVTWRALE